MLLVKQILAGIVVATMLAIGSFMVYTDLQRQVTPQAPPVLHEHWMLYHRKSNIEFLYHGIPGQKNNSNLIKTFVVKGGAPGRKPTPLPALAGRDYWLLTDKLEAFDNEETSPYFLVLDVPIPSVFPFGPEPYLECAGSQCNWEVPGYFGLHGINGDESRISSENEGSSGCVRHRDEDITFLYHLLDLKNHHVRYYIEDV